MAVAVPYSHAAPNLADLRDNTLTIRTVNYEIVHQVDGRLRLSVPRLGVDAKFAERLVDSVSALPAVKTARVNRGTSSLIVGYRQGPAGEPRSGEQGPSGKEAVLAGVIGCIRVAAKADVARNTAPALQAPPAAPQPRVDANYLVKQLGMPALGLGLSGALVAGVAVPPALVGATVLAATAPHALRAVQGLRTERRLTVETLDVTAAALLVAQSSFLAPAFMMAVIESAEVVRTLTARQAPKASGAVPSIQAAPQRDSRVSNYARKTGNFAVVPTLATSAAIWATSGSIGRATGIVALDFGLGMRVSAPVAILAAQSYAARNGIAIRSGRAMEMLGQVDAFVFDTVALEQAGSAEVLAGLRSLGKTVYIATGDGAAEARATAAAADVDPGNVYAGLLPPQKMDLVMALQAGGKKVAFVGDLDDDAAAMTYADVSVSFGSADALARETADVVLERDDLRDLPVALQIARRVLRTIRQNQLLVIGANSAGIAYAALAVLNPIAGVLLNNGVALVAALNSVRPFLFGGKTRRASGIELPAAPSPDSNEDESE